MIFCIFKFYRTPIFFYRKKDSFFFKLETFCIITVKKTQSAKTTTILHIISNYPCVTKNFDLAKRKKKQKTTYFSMERRVIYKIGHKFRIAPNGIDFFFYRNFC